MADGEDGWDDMPRLIAEAQAAKAKASEEAEKLLLSAASSSSAPLASNKPKRKGIPAAISGAKSSKAGVATSPNAGGSDSDSDSEISAIHELKEEHRLTFISHLENQTLSQLSDLAEKIDDKALHPRRLSKPPNVVL